MENSGTNMAKFRGIYINKFWIETILFSEEEREFGTHLKIKMVDETLEFSCLTVEETAEAKRLFC